MPFSTTPVQNVSSCSTLKISARFFVPNTFLRVVAANNLVECDNNNNNPSGECG